MSSRAGARVSVDGRNVLELKPGDGILVRAHSHPLASVVPSDDGGESNWFAQLAGSLFWNMKKVVLTKPTVVVKKDPSGASASSSSK